MRASLLPLLSHQERAPNAEFAAEGTKSVAATHITQEFFFAGGPDMCFGASQDTAPVTGVIPAGASRPASSDTGGNFPDRPS